MKTEITVAKEEVNVAPSYTFKQIVERAGVYNAKGFNQNILIISAGNARVFKNKALIFCELNHLSAHRFEPLNDSSWEDETFIEVNKAVTITFRP